jgi:hypothetical protein
MSLVRVTFNANNMDLRLMRPGLTPTHSQDFKQNQAGSGKIEQINFFGLFEPQVSVYIDTDDYRAMMAWWSWARQGKTWSIAVDSTKTTSTTLDGAAAAGQKVIPLTATTGFAQGDECLIRAEDNDDEFEMIQIASISAGVSITAVDNLYFSYTSGDTFRHMHYWPSVINTGKAFDPANWHRGWKTYTFKFAEMV